ncbi:DUF7553 family protein [Halopelagius longus]|uniref:Uncharacterized protein n=1 Tax=Halopelagius longus TaxID=1236180 RepID=A0A1H0YSE9_9EURY|nr:hypothetical protein [Halopelagius longus]RDI72653.1 hypothetical protein DWB78_13490 [Halopelagius longus]SDQ18099.1 hypothetical protein SAMN05216278_0815 [Halopelagius longus]
MNKHFEDAWYYLRRAGEHLSVGIREEAEPVERRVRKMLGREEEVPPSGRERLQAELRRRAPRRVEVGGKKAMRRAQSGIRRYRGGSAE